jgi:hypothetical protein
VENRGFWALEAPPKCEKQMNTRGPIYRLVGHWSAFERITCVRTHQLFVVERKVHVRPQITVVAARADWVCVRPLLVRSAPAPACDHGCVRTHQVRSNALGRNQLLHLVHFAFC